MFDRKAGGFIVRASAIVQAPPSAVRDVLTDFDNYPRISPDVAKTTVTSRTSASAMTVRFDMTSRPLVPDQWYLARYEVAALDNGFVLRFAMKDGTFKANSGQWQLRGQPDGSTKVVYVGEIEVDIPLAPKDMVRVGVRDGVTTTLNALGRLARR